MAGQCARVAGLSWTQEGLGEGRAWDTALSGRHPWYRQAHRNEEGSQKQVNPEVGLPAYGTGRAKGARNIFLERNL